MFALALSVAAATLAPVADFGDNPGSLAMFEHVPASVAGPMPLVLVLHGCGQDHTYAEQIGLVDVADAHGIAVAAAETNTNNNQDACFNWFVETDIDRGFGEAGSLASMVSSMQSRHNIDSTKIYIVGLSAGGAMAVAMLAVYPDVFAAGAVFAAIPYRCATDPFSAVDCVDNGTTMTKAELSALITDNNSSSSWPRIAIWTGTSDQTVNPQNSDALVKQWTGVHGLSLTATSSTTYASATVKRYGVDSSSSALPIIESVRVPNMDHGTPVDPSNGCGTAGNFAPDEHICAAKEALRFFGLDVDSAPAGEGEGEGSIATGEGEGSAGEGEGSAGEGEGSIATGEGEGEGSIATGEGEGEGAAAHGRHPGTETPPAGCAASSTSSFGLIALLAVLRARRRR
jgi:feruloyl esterase